MELMLDGERVQLFTVKPPPAGNDHQLVDKDLNVRVPVKAGPHVVGVAFPKKPSALLETERQPYQAHFNMDRHPAHSAGASTRSRSTVRMRRKARRHAQPPPDFCMQAAEAGRGRGLRQTHPSTLMRRAYRRPVTDAICRFR